MTRWFSSLRARLVLLVLIAALPAFGLILWTSLDQRQNDRRTAEDQATSLAQIAANQQGQFIEGSRQLLGLLVGISAQSINDGTGRPVDPEACGRAFAGVIANDQRYLNVGLVAPDGLILCSALPSDGPVYVSDRVWFQEAVETKTFATGEYQVGRITNQQTINFGYPIVDAAGRVRAVYFAAVDLAWLNSEAAKIKLPRGAALRMLDRDGTYLMRLPDPEKYVGTNIGDFREGKASVTSGVNVREAKGSDGTNRLYASAPAGGADEFIVSVGLPTSEIYGPINRALWRNMGLLAVVTGLALLAAWFVGERLITRHLRALTRTADRLRSGDLTARTNLQGSPSEVTSLAASFDGMARTLQQRDLERDKTQAMLRDTNIELERSEAAQRQANEELTRSNQELEQFAYVASHDLQEPLRMVGNYTQLLARRYKGRLDSDADEFIDYAVDGAKRMQGLINDLLAFSRVGTRGGEPVPTSAESALEKSLLNLGGSIVECQAVVTHDPLPNVTGDEAQLTQLFQNLIGNALKFRRNGNTPTIHVSAEQRATDWVLSVRDDGIGIAPEYHERIFVIFQRLHNREEYKGTGMGLAICKKIVERHGGRIWLESEEGSGTTFHFTLPQVAAEPVAA